MPNLSISQIVYVEIDYDDLDVDDLAKVLVTKKNYQAAINKALTKKPQTFQCEKNEPDEVKDLVLAFRGGKAVESIIANIAYNRYGLIC